MSGMPEHIRCRLIAQHVATGATREKIADALYEAVLEGLEFGPRDLESVEDREWVRGAVAIPLQDATDAALEVLSWSVSRSLERAPNGLIDRFERSHHLGELGLD